MGRGLKEWHYGLKCVFLKMTYPQDHSIYPREITCFCGIVPNLAIAVSSRSCLIFIALIYHLLPYQVLQNLGKDQYPQQSLEQIGTRIAKVLEKVRHLIGTLETIAHLLTFPSYLPLSGSNHFC